MSTALAFHPERHEYRLDGRPVPSVTQVIDEAVDFSAVPEATLERARAIGEAVHAAIEYDLAGDLDEASIDPVITGYLTGWRRFVADNDVEIAHSELPVYSERHQYAGTLDIAGHILGGPASVIDVKCARVVTPITGLQTAAYALAYRHAFGERLYRRYALQLFADGTYKLHAFKDRNDESVFLAALTWHQWRARHGLLTPTEGGLIS